MEKSPGKIETTICGGNAPSDEGSATRRKSIKAPEVMRASIVQAQAILDNIPDIAWLKDEESRFIAVNEAFGRACGHAPSELIGKTDLDIWPAELAERYRADDREVIQKRIKKTVEEPLADREGVMLWIETVKTPIFDDEGNIMGTTGIARDITARKRAEDETRFLMIQLEHQKDLLNEILSSTPDQILMYNRDGRLIYTNPAVSKLLGLNPEEIQGKTLDDLGFPPEMVRRIDKELEDIFNTGIPSAGETSYSTAHGTRYFEYIHSALHNTDGTVRSVLSTVRDITELKSLQMELLWNNDVQKVLNHLLRLSLKDIQLDEILSRALEAILAIPWLTIESKGVIFLVEEEKDSLVMRAHKGIEASLVEKCSNVPFGTCICGRTASIKEIKFASRLNGCHDITYEGITPHGHYCVPILLGEQLLGVLNLYLKSGHSRDEKEIEFLRLISYTLANIIQRKSAEEALKKAHDELEIKVDERTTELAAVNEYLNVLLSSFPMLLYRVNLKDNAGLTWISENVERVTGFPRERYFEDRDFWMKRLYPGDVQRLFRMIDESMGDSVTFEFRWLCADGSYHWFLDEMALIRDQEGKVREIVGNSKDETAHKIAEARIASQASLLDQARNMIISFNNEGEITYSNKCSEDLTGWSSQDILHKGIHVLYSWEAMGDPLPPFPSLLENQGSWRGEMNVKRKDGSSFPAECVISPIMDDEGSAIGGICISTDITDKKKLEAQFMQAQKMEAVGRLAGGIAHDFNNLLTTISGFGGFVMDALPPSDPRREDMQEILNAASRAVNLTRQLLAFSRRQSATLQILDLNEVIMNTNKMLRHLIGEDIELITVLSPNPLYIKADSGMMEQILMNIAVNARDAMASGGKFTIATSHVTLASDDSRRNPDTAPGEYVRLTISDTGVGMTVEVKSHIFEPFFTTKERGKGTGLGLATVYGIVKQFGGGIWVDSKPGLGSTFRIYLPEMSEERERSESDHDISVMPSGTETILVVEDANMVRKFAARILRGLGYVVLEAGNGVEALEVSANNPGEIHLLLTDMVMPLMGGRELSEKLSLQRPEMRVLFVSGYTDDRVFSLDNPDKPFLQKPFSRESLALKVREVLKAAP